VLDDMFFDDAGNLTIYRAMSVPPAWIKNAGPGSRLGIYWSHDPNTASPYDSSTNGDKEAQFLIEASLAPRYIDWDFIWHLHNRGENEVRLEPGDIVRVRRIWINGKPAALPNWIDKAYRV